jgi:FkbM family methyltransferase
VNFNKLCDLADFEDEELSAIIRDIGAYKLDLLPHLPAGAEHRKDWEVAMAVRALRHHGALGPDSVVLGVAAGLEDTLFYLTRHCRQVFATDRYVQAGSWAPVAPVAMLVDPAMLARFDFDRSRLVAQHMDARLLRYPDDTFDGIFSSGSIEHVGELLDVAHAAYEMGRVLKPGGVLSLSTEFQLSGPEGGVGWPGLTLVFSPAALQRYIIEASGLEMVDELDTELSPATIGTRVGLSWAIDDHAARIADPHGPGADADYACWQFPHVMLDHGGYLFGSVHLTLVKTDRYPLVPNEWARPSAATVEAIARYDRSAFAAAEPGPGPGPGPAGNGASPAPTPVPISSLDPGVAEMVGEAEVVRCLQAIGDQRHAVGQQLARLAEVQDRVTALTLAFDGDAPATPPLAGRARWLTPRVAVDGLQFSVVVDPDVADPITLTLLQGSVLDPTLVRLMLDIVRPGDNVVDLGAHLGTFSLAASAAGCQVLAVEAAPTNAALLRTSALRNGFAGLRVVQAAVADVPGEVQFKAHGPWGQVATGTATAATVTVPAVTVGELVAECGFAPVRFVKIDVEGSELRTLRGMPGLLASVDAPAVLYESNAHTLAAHGTTPNELMAELEVFGYTSYVVEPGRLVRTHSSELQTQTITDHLAVKRPPELAGWTVERAFTPEERIARLVADGGHGNPHHRANIAATLERADDDVLAHPTIVRLLTALRNDPVDDVRTAAAWSTE